jgi:hypothetical protein
VPEGDLQELKGDLLDHGELEIPEDEHFDCPAAEMRRNKDVEGIHQVRELRVWMIWSEKPAILRICLLWQRLTELAVDESMEEIQQLLATLKKNRRRGIETMNKQKTMLIR